MVHYWPLLLGLGIACIMGFRVYIATPAGRYSWDKLKLRLRLLDRLEDRILEGGAGIPELVCEFDDQNPVLGRKPHQHDHADLTVDVEALPAEIETEQGARDR